MQTFYIGVTQPLRFTIDTAPGGTFLNKTKDKSYNLIEKMALNNFEWSSERTQPKRDRGKLGLDVISMLSSKVDSMSQNLECVNVNAVSRVPLPRHVIYVS